MAWDWEICSLFTRDKSQGFQTRRLSAAKLNCLEGELYGSICTTLAYIYAR